MFRSCWLGVLLCGCSSPGTLSVDLQWRHQPATLEGLFAVVSVLQQPDGSSAGAVLSQSEPAALGVGGAVALPGVPYGENRVVLFDVRDVGTATGPVLYRGESAPFAFSAERSVVVTVVMERLGAVTERWSLADGADVSASVADAFAFDGAASLLPVRQTENSFGDFGQGILDGVQWNVADSALELVDGRLEGTYTSRVFDAGGVVGWRGLSWETRAPAGKALPTHGDESAYDSSNIATTGLVVSLSLDEVELETAGFSSDFFDASAFGFHGRAQRGPTLGEPGVLGWSVRLRTGTEAPFEDPEPDYIGLGAHPEFATEQRSFAAWVRRAQGCTPTPQDCPSAWVATHFDADADSGWSFYLGDSGRLALAANAGGNSLTALAAAGTAAVADDAWHHVGFTMRPGERHLFVDGEEVPLDFAGAGPTSALNDAAAFLQLGRSPWGNTNELDGWIDEVSVWQRELSPGEFRSLYRRGAHRVAVEVRACDNDDCSDGTFDGPHFPAASEELGRVQVPEVQARYFQYRATLTRLREDGGPQLKSASAEPSHVWAGPVHLTTLRPVVFSELLSVAVDVSPANAQVLVQLSIDGATWWSSGPGGWVVADEAGPWSSPGSASLGAQRFHTDVGSGELYYRLLVEVPGGEGNVSIGAVEVDVLP